MGNDAEKLTRLALEDLDTPDPRLAALEGQIAVLRAALTKCVGALKAPGAERRLRDHEQEAVATAESAIASTGSEAADVLEAARQMNAYLYGNGWIGTEYIDWKLMLGWLSAIRDALARLDGSARKGGENG